MVQMVLKPAVLHKMPFYKQGKYIIMEKNQPVECGKKFSETSIQIKQKNTPFTLHY